MRCVLAVDSGGSKCEAVLVRDDGEVLGWGICRVPGINGRSRDAAQEATRRALAPALGEIEELHVACLGGDLPVDVFNLREAFVVCMHVVGEYDGPLHLVEAEHGVVVLAGTGAFVYVRAQDGRHMLLDGHGPLLGDCGSGYQIGYRAMRAAMRSGWHARRRTLLEEAVFAVFQVRKPAEMIPLNFTVPDRSVIAALALEVDRAAVAGDEIARRILEEAAETLAETLRDAIEALGLMDEPLRMVGTGSVAKRSTVYWQHFCHRVAGFAPRLSPVLEPLPSAAGMALAVLGRLDEVDPQAVREKLFVTAHAFLNRQRNSHETRFSTKPE